MKKVHIKQENKGKFTPKKLKAQAGATIPAQDPNDEWIKKILEYEAQHGAADGSGLPNWGYNSRNPQTIEEAVNFFKQDYLPKVQQYPDGLKQRMADYMYNTGRNPNDLLLYNAGKIDLNTINGTGDNTEAWNTNKAEIEGLYSNPDFINKLDQSRDQIYKTTKQVNGQPNPAYANTWQGRLKIFEPYQGNQSTNLTPVNTPKSQNPFPPNEGNTSQYLWNTPPDINGNTPQPPVWNQNLTGEDTPVPNRNRLDLGPVPTIPSKDLRTFNHDNPNQPYFTPTKPTKPKASKSHNWGDVYTPTLAAIARMIPGQDIEREYVRPEDNLSYNPNPYGTGSQAIMKKGGKINDNEGYRKSNKKNFTSKKVIDSNFIDTNDMSVPAVLANGQLLQNNTGTHFIPGENVTEYPIMQAGGKVRVNIPQFEKTGILKGSKGGVKAKANKGLQVEDNQVKQISPNTFEFQGPSHAEGGIQASYAGKNFEAEGGEPVFVDSQKALQIMGNLKNPITGRKFKSDAKILAKQESKASKYKDEGTDLVLSKNPADKFERLAFNSGTAMMIGGAKALEEVQQSKENLANLQQLMLNSDEYQAKHGKKINYFQDGGSVSEDPRAKFEQLRQATLEKLQKKYPGKNIVIKYNDLGEARTIDQQMSIVANQRKKGIKLSPEYSLHNLDAARDFNIFIDGKFQGKDSPVYKEVLHPTAKELGLYSLSRGDDPFHVSLAQEGKGTSFSSLVKNYPNYLKLPGVSDLYDQLYSHNVMGNLTPAQQSAYQALSGDYTKSETTPFSDPNNLNINPPKELQGENVVNPAIDAVDTNLPTINESSMSNYRDPYNPTRVQRRDAQFNLTNPQPFSKPSNAENLNPTQLGPELYTLATNRQEPVQMQKYTPELFQPYQVSFQDRINENNSQLNATRRAVAYNPSALATLGAQAYSANSGVLADEFRTNQAISNDVTNKNIALLNDAELKNLQLGDTQFVRQTQAKTNTRAEDFEAIKSVASKYAQNRLENRTLQVYENLYPHYTFDQNQNYQVQKVGAPGQDYIRWDGVSNPIPTKIEETYGPTNTLQKTKRTYLDNEVFNKKFKKEPTSLFNNGGIVKKYKSL